MHRLKTFGYTADPKIPTGFRPVLTDYGTFDSRADAVEFAETQLSAPPGTWEMNGGAYYARRYYAYPPGELACLEFFIRKSTSTGPGRAGSHG